jgi:hypothetical protein
VSVGIVSSTRFATTVAYDFPGESFGSEVTTRGYLRADKTQLSPFELFFSKKRASVVGGMLRVIVAAPR